MWEPNLRSGGRPEGWIIIRGWRPVIAALAIPLVFASAACGDSSDGAPPAATDEVGGFAGVVTGGGGAPIADMRVGIVSGTAPFPEIAVVTDANGAYTIGGVPLGTFQVAVFDLQGQNVGQESVVVTGGVTATLNFTVSP